MSRELRRGAQEAYPLGSRIRITSSPLLGLTGVVVRVATDKPGSVLTIDGFPEGVYVTINNDYLSLDPPAVD